MKTLIHSWVNVGGDTSHTATVHDGRAVFQSHLDLAADLHSHGIVAAPPIQTETTILYHVEVDMGMLVFAVYLLHDTAQDSTDAVAPAIQSSVTPDAVARAQATRAAFQGDAPAVTAFNPNPMFDAVAGGRSQS